MALLDFRYGRRRITFIYFILIVAFHTLASIICRHWPHRYMTDDAPSRAISRHAPQFTGKIWRFDFADTTRHHKFRHDFDFDCFLCFAIADCFRWWCLGISANYVSLRRREIFYSYTPTIMLHIHSNDVSLFISLAMISASTYSLSPRHSLRILIVDWLMPSAQSFLFTHYRHFAFLHLLNFVV